MESVRTVTFGGRVEWINPKNQRYHREDGPAVEAVEQTAWYWNGFAHRIDGPAVVYTSGAKFWYIHGKKHRLDGPAVELSNGTVEYWVDGVNYEYVGCRFLDVEEEMNV